jgi:hypothetical protein
MENLRSGATIAIKIDVNQVVGDLNAIADGLYGAVEAGIHDDAAELLALTAEYTPYGPGPQNAKDNLPHMRDTFTFDTGGGLTLESWHPGARVVEFGGTIAPNHSPIHFVPREMAYRAAEESLPAIEKLVRLHIDELIASHQG